MSLRDRLQTALKEAMKAKAAARLSTLRLINAAIKDREIANRGEADAAEVTDADILALMSKMVKQRMESARAYEEGGRLELAEKETNEIKVIEEFLPRQLSGDEVEAAVVDAIVASGASSIRDMGRVMAVLKGKYTGQMDFGAAAGLAWVSVNRPRPKTWEAKTSAPDHCCSFVSLSANSPRKATRSAGVRNAPSSTSRPFPVRVR